MKWDRIKEKYGLTGSAGDKEIVGRLQNYFIDLGPLHIGINLGGDAAEHWHFLCHRLFHKITGKNLLEGRVPLRDQMQYMELFTGIWLYIRSSVKRKLLEKGTPTARSFVWAMETTIPVGVLHYGVVFKINRWDRAASSQLNAEYFNGLAFSYTEVAQRDRRNYKKGLLNKLNQYLHLVDIQHPLLRLILDNMDECDESKNEGGVIRRIAEVMKQSKETEICINNAYRVFASTMEPGVQDTVDKLVHVTPHHSSLFGSNWDIAFRFAMELMLEIVNSLLIEKAEDIIFVTNEREEMQTDKVRVLQSPKSYW